MQVAARVGDWGGRRAGGLRQLFPTSKRHACRRRTAGVAPDGCASHGPDRKCGAAKRATTWWESRITRRRAERSRLIWWRISGQNFWDLGRCYINGVNFFLRSRTNIGPFDGKEMNDIGEVRRVLFHRTMIHSIYLFSNAKSLKTNLAPIRCILLFASAADVCCCQPTTGPESLVLNCVGWIVG